MRKSNFLLAISGTTIGVTALAFACQISETGSLHAAIWPATWNAVFFPACPVCWAARAMIVATIILLVLHVRTKRHYENV